MERGQHARQGWNPRRRQGARGIQEKSQPRGSIAAGLAARVAGRSAGRAPEREEAQDRTVKHLLTRRPPRAGRPAPASLWALLLLAALAALSVGRAPASPLGGLAHTLTAPARPLSAPASSLDELARALTAPARPLAEPGRQPGQSIALDLGIAGLSLGGPGRVYAADVEGVSTRGSARTAPSDLGAIRAQRRTGLAGTWDAIRSSGFARRLQRVTSWVAGGVRLLWSIPKAVIQGDSSALIEAIGDLLSGAPGEQDKTVEPSPASPDPDPSGEPRQGVVG